MGAAAGLATVERFVQELLGASALALGTAFIGGVLIALILHRVGLLERALVRWSVRSITVSRNKSALLPADSVPDTVGAVDPAWARKRSLVSLTEYFYQLEVSDGVREQWVESALLALLKGMGLGAPADIAAGLVLNALPIGAVLPDSVTKTGDHPLAVAAAEMALDPLALATAARIIGCQVGSAPATELLAVGGEPADSTPALGLAAKSVVRLPEDLLLAETEAFATETPTSVDRRYTSKDATPISTTLLPDLCFGTGGLTSQYTRRQEFRNRYLAAVLNRLVANRLDDRQSVDFAVEIGKYKHVTSTGAFMQAIGHSNGCLDARFQSQVANFGVDLCLQEEGSRKLKPVPFVFAMWSGVVDPISGQNIALPATHGSLHVQLALSDGFDLGTVQFYAGTEGFCGWHPDSGWQAPWRAGHVQHGEVLSMDELTRAADYGTALAVASARCAEQYSLSCGGYGDLGICNDSAAVLQLCVRNVCTFGQTGGTGVGPQRLFHTAMSLADDTAPTPRKRRSTGAGGEQGERDSTSAHPNRNFAICIREVAEAVRLVPLDPLVSPEHVADCAKRALATIEQACRELPLPRLKEACVGLRRAGISGL